MKQGFIHESNHFTNEKGCNWISVTISIYLLADETYDWEVDTIYDRDAEVERSLKDFPEDERIKIMKSCQELADEHAGYLLDEYLQDKAERQLDAIRDEE